MQYRELAGTLNCLVSQIHPDICFDACQLSSSIKDPSLANITRPIRRLKETPLLISLLNLRELTCAQLESLRYASNTNLTSTYNGGALLSFL